MSWLNAIENILGAGEGGVNVKSQIRMARAIRELVKYAKALENRLAEKGFDRRIARGPLPPDAKEAINESTAPRST